MTGSLAGKVAVVTGGAQGLGRAISERLANEDAVVVIADVNEQGAKSAAAAIAEATGARVVGVKTDVTNEAEVAKLFDEAEREFGRVDVVVSNAAILIAAPIAEADAEKWRAVMTVNLFGYFLVTKHACRIMKRQRSGSSSTSIPSQARKAAPPTPPMRRASSARSATPRASPWRWRVTTCAAMPSAPAISSIPRFGRTLKKAFSSSICAREKFRARKTSTTFARPTSIRFR